MIWQRKMCTQKENITEEIFEGFILENELNGDYRNGSP